MLPKLYTVKEVSEYLRCGSNAVYTMIKNGTLPHTKIQGSYRIREDALLDYIKSNSRGD
ncbi:helix-turn-helix domain-containing protein [Pectinatus frisingensis]|uniref:helix-turn-helix domain-containing protein n=1 Tax=Pectinatus frisingensis TaxID=865 RepID=UPI0018C46082|nr:helix-turn-helix domain-containing protein [Pectinatus frisingensis]